LHDLSGGCEHVRQREDVAVPIFNPKQLLQSKGPSRLVAYDAMRMKRRFLAMLVLVLLAIGSSSVMADSFRCGTYIIREGMPSAEIKEKCGDPDLVKTSTEPIFSRLKNGATVQTGVTTTDYWFYDRGPNQFVARVTIRESQAEEIEVLDVRNIESLKDE
jgi:hypothetical protein